MPLIALCWSFGKLHWLAKGCAICLPRQTHLQVALTENAQFVGTTCLLLPCFRLVQNIGFLFEPKNKNNQMWPYQIKNGSDQLEQACRESSFENRCWNLALMVSSSLFCALLSSDFIPSLLTVHWSSVRVTLSGYRPVIHDVWYPCCSTQIRPHTQPRAPPWQQHTTHLPSIWGHSNLLGHGLLSAQRSLEKTSPNYKPQSHCPPGSMLPFYSWSTNTSSPWQLPPDSPTHTPTHPHTHAQQEKVRYWSTLGPFMFSIF